MELFLEGARHPDLNHRHTAFGELKALDPDRFRALLMETLEKLPATPEGDYWNSRESALGQMVTDRDDPQLWQTLLKVAKRSDVGLRMEFIGHMDREVGPNVRRRQLDFLAAFLEDRAVRDIDANSKFKGPCAGFNFPRIEVRDVAAMEIATIMKMGIEPQPEWTAKQWADFHQKVREALKERKDK